jgi:hypothetical protein
VPTTGTPLKFYDNLSPLAGTVTLKGTTATTATYTITTSSLPASLVGHSITAQYTSPNGNFASSPMSTAIIQTVKLATTAVNVTTVPTVWADDAPTTFTIVVTLTNGVGSTLLTSGTHTELTLSGVPGLGVATYVPGRHTATTETFTYTTTMATNSTTVVTATYTPSNVNVAGSFQTLPTQNVRHATKLTLVASSSPTTGTPTIFTTTLTGAGGVPIANKQITIVINGTSFTVTTNGSGVATVSYTFAAAGTFTATASLTGDPQFNDALASLSISVVAKSTGRQSGR